nr:semaphorin-7A-like [Danio rerio]|eukprot:XP_003201673.4 semaphorin-7A-like [Danio rerio]
MNVNSCMFLLLMWTSYACASKIHHNARVTVKKEGISRFAFENSNNSFIKLLSASNITWVVINERLYYIDTTQDFRPKPVNVNLCRNDLTCAARVSVLTEGANGNLLFLCGTTDEEKTMCCSLNSTFSLTNCFDFEHYKPDINEPSLLVGDMLYFTLSEKGLYRINKNKERNIWPPSTQTEQKYLKLIAGEGQHKDKMYSFFAEKHKNKEDESDQWIPRVSQNCMNDKGGPKGQLQSSWTSMIYARLECGKRDFTQLIDVATIKTTHDTKIYALFRNYWNMSAVCVYNMTEISTIFNSSQFNANNVPVSHRPGTCVVDSTQLNGEVLTFMKERPEMKQTVKPENGPLIFRHHHYSHIQVDRVQDSTVLLLSLESGGVHKVLERPVQEPVFVIAEYLPFPHGSSIASMILHTSENLLYASSGNELIQIDLATCGVYGNECVECRLSRDPYCKWDGLQCTIAEKTAQDTNNCDKPPYDAPSRTITGANVPVISVQPSSKYFLVCPVISHHATYHWYHSDTREECASTDEGCIYLIESMNKTHEGSYRCEYTENGITKTVSYYELSMSLSNGFIPILIPHALLLLTAFHILL